MQITVFGANGDTGSEIVKFLIESGHRVVCAVRRPETITTGPNKLVAKIDLTDHASLLCAMRGSSAVISALGTGGIKKARQPTTLYSDATRAIRAAMRELGLKRIVVLSSSGVDEEDAAPWFYNALLRRYIMNSYIDMARMETILEESPDLDWTVVRLTYLVKHDSKPFLAQDGELDKGNFKIGYVDAGKFVAKEVVANEWVHKHPVLGYDK